MNPTVRVISSTATRALLAELLEMRHQRRDQPVIVESVGGVDAARRVAAGEPFDVAVLASDAIHRLVEWTRASRAGYRNSCALRQRTTRSAAMA